MKIGFFLSFLTLGLVSIIAQVIFLRELMVVFYGNELFLGLALGFWLFWTAAGSFAGRKLISRKNFLANLLILAFILPLSLAFIRFLKSLFPPGILIDFPKAIGLTFLSLAPIGFSLGFFFTTAFFEKSKKLAPLASRAYLIETMGFALGGLTFSFFLIKHSPFLVAFFLSISILGLAFHFFKKKITPLLLIVIFLFALIQLSFLEKITNRFQFPGLVETKNSIYGRISVTQKGNQFNFYESGALTGISQKTEDAEYLIHPIMLQHPNPERILMIGGGFDGALTEILKHQPEKATYVELDPDLIETTQKYLQDELAETLKDQKVDLQLIDARQYLKKTQDKFDVVIINLPPPSTALINRLYTQEAFGEIKAILNPKGILAVNLRLPTDYLSEESKNLAASIYQTLGREYEQISLFPEYSLLYLASDQPLTSDFQLLTQRLNERQVKTDFISPAYLEDRLTDDRIKMFTESLQKGGQVNRDFHPIAYFYQTAFWQGIFSHRLAIFYSQLPQIVLPSSFIALIIIISFLLWQKHRQKVFPHVHPGGVYLLGLTGAAVMIWEIILIFAFQVKLGYIYRDISLLLAIILTGMTLGNYLASRFLAFEKHLKIILWFLIAFSLLMPISLTKIENFLAFYLLALTAGTFSGAVFPLIMQGYLKNKRQIGVFYGADLMGSFLGAIFVSLFSLPILGVWITAYLLTLFFLIPLLLQKPGR